MIPEENKTVVIVAGGKGVRMGVDLPKQFLLLNKVPILMHTIQAFYDYDYRIRIIVVLPDNYMSLWNKLCKEYGFDLQHQIVSAGKTRFHSVKNGLSPVSDAEIVAIHDAARPFISQKLIERCFTQSIKKQCGIVPVIDMKESVRRVTNNNSFPLDRSVIKIVQTPQVFPSYAIKQAYDIEYRETFTDDASVAEASGVRIETIQGDEFNFKITTRLDMEIAEILLQKKQSQRV